MERKAIIILVVTVIAAVSVLVLLGAYTGWVTYHQTENGIVVGGDVSIHQGDIKACCTFIDADGQERTCGVIQQYSCDYCADFC